MACPQLVCSDWLLMQAGVWSVVKCFNALCEHRMKPCENCELIVAWPKRSAHT